MKQETDIGNRLRNFINENYKNQKKFSELTNVDASAINRYITGKSFPNVVSQIRFQLAGLSINWLLSGIGLPNESIDYIHKLREQYREDERFQQTVINLQENDVYSTRLRNVKTITFRTDDENSIAIAYAIVKGYMDKNKRIYEVYDSLKESFITSSE